MTLSFAARHSFGEFTLDVAFESRGRLTALFGPSGSGKSTVINLIAGLIRPQQARIDVDGHVLADTAARLLVPRHRRRIGYVFQDARLFPHLTVAQNLGYGRFFVPRGEHRADPGKVIELLGIGHLLHRRPDRLSGGERQRIAIGRALLASPRIILMDEPLASLDEERKAEILPHIERLRDEAGVPIVYVSHAIGEVARLASDVVVLKAGRSVASGSAGEVLQRLDLLSGGERDEAGVLIDLVLEAQEAGGLSLLRAPSGTWRLPRLEAAIGARVRARVRARDVMLATGRPVGISALNVLEGSIEAVTAGEQQDALVRVACGGDRILARITRHSLAALALGPGVRVFAIVKAVTFTDRNQPYARPKDA